jgi:protein-S-isoprenylcysteine O-methyltransferase Ste14
MGFVIRNLWLLFFLSELVLLIFKRSGNAGEKNARDRYSLIILWIVIPGSLILGSLTANFEGWNDDRNWLTRIGILLLLAGGAVRWLAIVQLGKSFTVDVAISKDQELKTTGLYQKLRHPSYSGLLLMVLGLSLTMNSLLSVLIIMIPIFIGISYRIKIEERSLSEAFGERFKAYKQKTKRIIPWIY